MKENPDVSGVSVVDSNVGMAHDCHFYLRTLCLLSRRPLPRVHLRIARSRYVAGSIIVYQSRLNSNY